MAFQFEPDIDQTLATTLILAEGDEAFVYKDSLGFDTIGIGRCVDHRVAGSGLTHDERRYLLQNDIRKARQDLLFRYPWALTLNGPRFRAMMEMLFVLGYPKMAGFNEFIVAMIQEDYVLASKNLLNSKWHTEAPTRVARIALTILTGKD